jgi:hypothetical protein
MFNNGSVQGLLDHGCATSAGSTLGLPETRTGLSYEIQVQVLVVTRR